VLDANDFCDGFNDCAASDEADLSDETDCPPPILCADGETEVLFADQCDGFFDCPSLESGLRDVSDEAGCDPETVFYCEGGEPIPASWICDGDDDCADYDETDFSDEADCLIEIDPEVPE